MNEDFETVLKQVLTETPTDTKIDKDKFDDLSKALKYLSNIVPNANDIELEIAPIFAHGSLSVKLNSFEIKGSETEELSSLLDWCDAFEVVPMTDGRVEVMITVNDLFE